MKEGRLGDEYLILFAEGETASATERYQLEAWLPGFVLVGIRSWDDLIVRDVGGRTYTIPSVPLDQKHLAPFSLPQSPSLDADDRYTGKIKWYVSPLVFGGDPRAKDNINWVNHDQHAALVAWWNAKYVELKTRTGGS